MTGKQSKLTSFLEGATKTAIGLVLAFSISQFLSHISPNIDGFSYHVSLEDNMVVTGILTIVALLRGYLIRRAFNFFEGWTFMEVIWYLRGRGKHKFNTSAWDYDENGNYKGEF